MNVATNFDCSRITSVKRFSAEKKNNIDIPKPEVIVNYNKYMGGVDQMDESIACYRTRMRQKKWWWPIFLYFIDATVVNAWILWKKKTNNKTLKLLSFRRVLAITMLKKYGIAPKQGKQAASPVQDIRHDGIHHYLRKCQTRRCGNCTGKAAFFCTKCDVGLHPRCQEDYHTKK